MANSVPSDLALSVINENDPVASAPHRNNYAAIQTDVNDLSACLSGGTLGQVLEAVDDSHVQWAVPPGHEIGYDQSTANTSITGTTSASATTIIAGSAYSFDGSPVIAEFYANMVETPSSAAGNAVVICLFEGGVLLNTIAQVTTVAATSQIVPVLARVRFSPSAGTHTYSIMAFASNTTGTPRIDASGTNAPTYLRITKA